MNYIKQNSLSRDSFEDHNLSCSTSWSNAVLWAHLGSAAPTLTYVQHKGTTWQGVRGCSFFEEGGQTTASNTPTHQAFG